MRRAGKCYCGCGQSTSIAKRNDKRDGNIKGKPVRYIHNHHRRKSPVEYIEEDRGYKTKCWVWQKAVTPREMRGGYGHVYDGEKMRPAHIVYYERKYGKVPPGRELDHLCRVRCCVNPDHLEPVTDAINTQRGNNAILMGEEVKQIRLLALTTPKSELAALYGVSVSNIKMIVTGKSWRNIA